MIMAIVLLLLLPVAINVGSLSGKPIYITPSDFLLFVTLVHAALINPYKNNKLNAINSGFSRVISLRVSFFALIIVYFIIIGLVGSIIDSSLVNVVSAIKFVKPIMFVFCGLYWSKIITVNSLYTKKVICSFLIIVSLLIGDVLFGNFPYPRLGGKLLDFDVYGFPNSSAVFYSVYFCIFVYYSNYTTNYVLKYLLNFSLVMMALMVIGTLSRAGMINICFVLLFLIFFKQAGTFRMGLFFIGAISCSILYLVKLDPDVFIGLNNKLSKFSGDNDLSNGRFDIWISVLDSIGSSYLFGRLFEPFSNYHSGHDTAHNQYLEVLFKSGSLGFLLYFSFFIYVSCKILKRNGTGGVKPDLYFIALLFSLSLTNVVQPNFSYSITGAYVFFMSGFFVKKNI